MPAGMRAIIRAIISDFTNRVPSRDRYVNPGARQSF